MSKDLLSKKSIKKKKPRQKIWQHLGIMSVLLLHRRTEPSRINSNAAITNVLIQTQFLCRCRACTQACTLSKLGQELQSISVINVRLFKPPTFKRVSFRDAGRTSCVVALCERSDGGGAMEDSVCKSLLLFFCDWRRREGDKERTEVR